MSIKLNYLFYTDDLKSYPNNDENLEGLLNIVKGFSDNIGIQFGLDKCTKVTFRKGLKTSPQI